MSERIVCNVNITMHARDDEEVRRATTAVVTSRIPLAILLVLAELPSSTTLPAFDAGAGQDTSLGTVATSLRLLCLL